MSERAEKLRRWAQTNEKSRAGKVTKAASLSEPGRDGLAVLDIETTGKRPWDSELLCVGIGTEALRPDEGRETARKVMSHPGVVICHTSFDLRWLALDGAKLHPGLQFHDTRVMGWLLDGNQSLALDDLCLRWLGYKPPKVISVHGGELMFTCRDDSMVPLAQAPWDELAAYNESDLNATRELYEALRAGLENAGQWGRFLEQEVPLSGAILGMEVAGLPFDLDRCNELRDHVEREAGELAEKLKRDGGLPPTFNLGSSKQVADYIFGKGEVLLPDRVELDPAMKLVVRGAEDKADALNDSGLLPEGFTAGKVGRDYAHGAWVVQGREAVPAEAGFGASVHWKEAHRERSRPSTSSLSLVLKNPDDEWIGDLVLHRELVKLHGSFLSKFPTYVHEGRLHGTINRTGTATGRFSSSEPNLQQIPAHGNYGAHVRGLFVGDLAVGDYSQLEQRMAGHLSGDANLVKAYREDVDLYGLAASICFGGEPSKDHPQRGLMKTGMLALQYGAGAGKLAQLLLVDGHEGATTEQAEGLIDQLKGVFPDFFAWKEECGLRAARNGWAQTIGGRRRPLEFPEGWARMRARRRFGSLSQEEVRAAFAAERQAVNTECQGGAADVVAGALLAIVDRMPEEALLINQVHDEILVERLPGWGSSSCALFQECAEKGHGFELAVPLAFEAKEVGGWDEKSGGSARHVSSGFQKRLKEARSEGLQSRKASAVARRKREAAKA